LEPLASTVIFTIRMRIRRMGVEERGDSYLIEPSQRTWVCPNV